MVLIVIRFMLDAQNSHKLWHVVYVDKWERGKKVVDVLILCEGIFFFFFGTNRFKIY